MVHVDYMAHQEQYAPSQLLRFGERAESAGFDFVWTSDHFHPWFDTNAEAGFAWSWLGALGERVDLPMGTCVTATAGHYHPGILAQAGATLQELHDERVVIGLGTGEAMNETPLGFDWPAYPERRERLEESIEIIRQLWDQDGFVTYDGDHYQLDEAKLYTTPDRTPELHVAANGPSTAAIAGRAADGFITPKKGETYTDRLAPAIKRHAREAGRDPEAIESTLLVIVSYDPDYDRAVEATRPWWATTQDVFDRALANPEKIEAEGANATLSEVKEKFLIATSPEEIVERLEVWAAQGFDRIALGNTSPDPESFFDVMEESIIPSLH